MKIVFRSALSFDALMERKYFGLKLYKTKWDDIFRLDFDSHDTNAANDYVKQVGSEVTDPQYWL